MPYCPACAEAFDPGTELCPHCELPLQEQRPLPDDTRLRLTRHHEDTPWPIAADGEPEQAVLLHRYGFHRDFQLAQLNLRGYGVPFIDDSMSQKMLKRIYMGQPMQNGGIYVPASLVDDARILLGLGREGEDEEDDGKGKL